MACSLTRGFNIDCMDNVGGIAEIKVKVLPSANTLTANYTVSSGVVTIASGSQSAWYKYECPKGTSYANSNSVSDQSAGTVVYNQEIKVAVNKLMAGMQNEIKLLSQNRLQVAVKTNNGDYWLFGYTYGMNVNTASTTGTNKTDRSGQELTFTGEEAVPFLNMTSGTYDSLIQ